MCVCGGGGGGGGGANNLKRHVSLESIADSRYLELADLE